MNGPILDIVVPAFRGRFLRDTLESLAVQEDRAFRLIVADDASPEDLEPICSRYRTRMDLKYHRFPQNLGASRLVAQWNRSVRLGTSPWVWLFSDDDVASRQCVGALRQALAQGPPLVRLDVRVIGVRGQVIDVPPDPPPHECWELFLWQRLKMRRQSFAVEYAFRRDRWEQVAGFVDLPAAWTADDASWIALAGDDGIRHAPGGWVGWRRSESNLSGRRDCDREKREGCLQFLERIGQRGLEAMETRLGLAPGVSRRAASEWFWWQMDGLRLWTTRAEAQVIQTRLKAVLGTIADRSSLRLYKRNLRLVTEQTYRRLAKR